MQGQVTVNFIRKGDYHMAYINEMIPKEERKGYMIPNYKEIKPVTWTINKEKDIKLFKYWNNIDDSAEKYFALVWKDAVIKVILRGEFIEDNTIMWKLQGISIPYNCGLGEKEVLAELREALKAYAGFGYLFVERTIKTETITDF